MSDLEQEAKALLDSIDFIRKHQEQAVSDANWSAEDSIQTLWTNHNLLGRQLWDAAHKLVFKGIGMSLPVKSVQVEVCNSGILVKVGVWSMVQGELKYSFTWDEIQSVIDEGLK